MLPDTFEAPLDERGYIRPNFKKRLGKGFVQHRGEEVAMIAASFFKLAYEIRVKNLPKGMSETALTRNQLDRLGIGAELTSFRWGSKTVLLPPSRLAK